MTSTLSLFLIGILVHVNFAADSQWSYCRSAGPSNWFREYPKCADSSQSPINIYEGDVSGPTITDPFTYTNYNVARGLTMTLSNNGHSAVVSLSGSSLPTISGGGLPSGDYVAAQFHFHWNTDPTKGSEHFISSTGYPAELHIVHYKKSYGSLSAAVAQPDGLAVLGFMVEISDSANPNYYNLVSKLSKVTKKGSEGQVLDSVTLNSFLPNSFQKFYRYSGSLTTPPCYESVTWTVFKSTIKMSEYQVRAFQDLKDASDVYIYDNVRPLMPLNDRKVTASFDPAIKWSYAYGTYTEPNWAKYYASCGGTSQSPVNIPSAASTKSTTLGSFTLTKWDDTTGVNMELKNDGHTATVHVTGATAITVSGASLPESYRVAQFHLHWGASSMMGSEHTVDGVKYPMEIHFVTYKTSLGSLGAAATKPEGLAVLGFFFEISENNNAAYDPIVNLLMSVANPDDTASLSALRLDSLIPSDYSKFYRYSGSLTTPGCYESVIWSVFQATIPISEAQMNKFRALKSSEKDSAGTIQPMVNNFRLPQFLNSRVVSRNFDHPITPKQKWTYTGDYGPQKWYKYFPVCASTTRQSPINIDNTLVDYQSMESFTFSGFDTTTGVSMMMGNDGHTITVSYTAGDLTVSGGELPNTFKVAQFHFHWGSDNSLGSEHTIDNKMYPMEVHIVTYNELYSNINVAVSQGNGLAVLGFMFEVTENDNPKLEPFISSLSSVQNPDSETSITAFALQDMLPSKLTNYYRYDGSLTTPTCDESVTWTVFQSTIPISENQLNKFRGLKSSDLDTMNNTTPMVNNYRPVQDIGSRKVYANFLLGSTGGSSSSKSVSVTSAIACVFFAVCNIARNS